MKVESISARRDVFGRLSDLMFARPGMTAFVLGLVAACGFPPFHAWWIAIPAIAAFIVLLGQAPNWRSATWLGWLFGWSHLTLANNWIATAFTYQAKMPEVLGWVAVPLLGIYLALYPALAVLAAYLIAGRTGPARFGIALAGAWIVTEWLRSWVFTGYPWPPLGLMLLGGWEEPGLAVLLPWLGTYALSGLVVLLAAALASLVAARLWAAGIALAISIAAAMLFLGRIQSELAPTDIRYRLVQPLLTQDEIDDPSRFEEQFERIARLTAPGRDQSRIVLWPESAVPDYLEDGYPQSYYDRMTAINPANGRGDPAFARQRIAAVAGPDSTVLTGAVNLDFQERAGIISVESARNSVIAINGEGEIVGNYAKAHLVPYGEYLPMRTVLEPLGLSRLVGGSIDYHEGPGPKTIDLGDLGRAGVQICYEIVFSGQVVEPGARPDYIFNPSNDGWFGEWGPPQHLAQARMRAIEEGLPVLRATTTGISAVIDAHGKVRQVITRGKAGAVEGFVPRALPATWFAQWGNALPVGWAALLLALAAFAPRKLALRRSRV